jgi:two-component SAPR family response regulator
VTQHPQEMEKILTYVFAEIQSLWEYMGKKTEVEKHYHKEIHELKEEYGII